MKWITRHRPKVDRIACPWLIKRFVDKDAEFIYVPPDQVVETARRTGAIPYDVEGVELTHDGPLCSFDAILKKYKLNDPALNEVATIIRGADTNRHDLAPQVPGVYAILIGLSHNFSDDHEQLKHGMIVCESLYAWCKHPKQQKHDRSLQPKV
ncbi:MAG: chromate resistance protein [Phycisphaerales bacterium]|nr:chromate resistance protein [Phycisphaerales bacterium]MCI0675571.1 chromate resistance protein [Phycisphaerales bacterium]